MISRRDFLKLAALVGLVPLLPKGKQEIAKRPDAIWGFPINYTEWPEPPMPMTNQNEWHLYSGSSVVSDVHIGMLDAPWKSHDGGHTWSCG